MARLTKTSSKASKTRAREAIRAKGRKTSKPGKAERAITPAAKPRAGRSVTELKAQLVLRTKELDEALARQAASAEILKVIASSPDNVQPVLDVIVAASRRLCSARSSVIFLLR